MLFPTAFPPRGGNVLTPHSKSRLWGIVMVGPRPNNPPEGEFDSRRCGSLPEPSRIAMAMGAPEGGQKHATRLQSVNVVNANPKVCFIGVIGFFIGLVVSSQLSLHCGGKAHNDVQRVRWSLKYRGLSKSSTASFTGRPRASLVPIL